MPDTKCDVSVLVCVRLLLSIAQQAAARLTGKWRLTLCGGRRGREGRGVSSEAREVFFLFNEPGPFRCRVEAVVVVGGGEGGGKGAREERAGGGRGGRRRFCEERRERTNVSLFSLHIYVLLYFISHLISDLISLRDIHQSTAIVTSNFTHGLDSIFCFAVDIGILVLMSEVTIHNVASIRICE